MGFCFGSFILISIPDPLLNFQFHGMSCSFVIFGTNFMVFLLELA